MQLESVTFVLLIESSCRYVIYIQRMMSGGL